MKSSMDNIGQGDKRFWQRDYDIALVKLKEGHNERLFRLDETFFAHFTSSPISISKLTVRIDILKQTGMYQFQFNIEGTVNVACDRCTEQFDLYIDEVRDVILKLNYKSDKETIEETEIIYISSEEDSFNIAQLLYEFVNLSMPMRKIHPDGEEGKPTCDPKIISLLEEGMPDENSSEKPEIDPRWAALQQLKNKKK